MISEKERLAVKERFAEMERATQDGMTLGDNARMVIENAKDLRLSEDALMPVLRTALVINWPEKAMCKRYEQFRTQFPEISTLQDMRDVMDREDPVVFCHRYLDIKATSSANPKYCLLRELC